MLKFSASKGRAIFDYAKLRKAIPKIWLTQLSNDGEKHVLPLAIPKMYLGKSVRRLNDISSKYFYQLMLEEQSNARCCFFWESMVGNDVSWKSCFERNLVRVKENKLREFERG